MTHQQKCEQEVKEYKAFLEEKDRKVAELTKNGKELTRDDILEVFRERHPTGTPLHRSYAQSFVDGFRYARNIKINSHE